MGHFGPSNGFGGIFFQFNEFWIGFGYFNEFGYRVNGFFEGILVI